MSSISISAGHRDSKTATCFILSGMSSPNRNFTICGRQSNCLSMCWAQLVVVGVGQNTATGLVVKSADVIYRGDRVELVKSK